jgi:hypothetical protein
MFNGFYTFTEHGMRMLYHCKILTLGETDRFVHPTAEFSWLQVKRSQSLGQSFTEYMQAVLFAENGTIIAVMSAVIYERANTIRNSHSERARARPRRSVIGCLKKYTII